MLHSAWLVCALLGSTVAGGAQQSATAFDIVSVKPDKTLSGRSHVYAHWGTTEFKAVNVTAQQLLALAYDVPESQVIGGPGWLGSDRFDIDAKSDGVADEAMAQLTPEAARAEKLTMLQALLGDRFGCTAHRETRELPVFHLVVTKAGSKLQATQGKGLTINSGRDHLQDDGATLAILSEQLAQAMGRPVVDQTGLAGRFDLTLRWTPDDSTAAAADSAPPSLPTAVEEQLGLRLEPAKGPVQVLVLDKLQQPAPN